MRRRTKSTLFCTHDYIVEYTVFREASIKNMDIIIVTATQFLMELGRYLLNLLSTSLKLILLYKKKKCTVNNFVDNRFDF